MRGKSREIGKALLVLAILAAIVVWLDKPDWQVFGKVTVVDGDSLIVSGERLRLAGIDAPELEQRCLYEGRGLPCGQDSRKFLRRLIGGADLRCTNEGDDRHGRRLAFCKTVDNIGEQQSYAAAELLAAIPDVPGFDRTLNAAMVFHGWAVSFGEYSGLELLARTAGRGIWQTQFERPQDWRRANGLR